MQFYFHILDKYGLSPDSAGCEYADQDAAIEHARRLAAELAKAGEFSRSSVVLVTQAAAPESVARGAKATQPAGPAEFPPSLPTENP